MRKSYIVGVGSTKYEKPGAKTGDYPLWVKEAVEKALQDAKINYGLIEQVFTCIGIEDTGGGQRAMQEVGLTGVPIYNITSNCASGSVGIYLARELVEMGRHDCILVVGYERMDKGSVWTLNRDRAYPIQNHIKALTKITDFNEELPNTPQFFGFAGMEHMKKYGTTLEHFAKIAYKNRKHGVNNEHAQFRKEYSIEEILNSTKVFGPLTLLQCCPTTNAAAAVVIASEKFIKEHRLQSQAVEIMGVEMVTDLPSTFNSDSCLPIIGYDIIKKATDKLFENARITRDDVQVIELHDSFSTFELMLYEAMGLCEPGKAGEFIDRGDNTYGGKYVINPSGGLMSKGHPFGATGIGQCIELCLQLRGEAGKRQVANAKIALQQNVGLATAVVVALYQKARFLDDKIIAG